MAKMGEFATMPQSLFNGVVQFYSTNQNLSHQEQLDGLVALAKASAAAAAAPSDHAVDIVELTMLCIDIQNQKNAANRETSVTAAFSAAVTDLTNDMARLEGLYR